MVCRLPPPGWPFFRSSCPGRTWSHAWVSAPRRTTAQSVPRRTTAQSAPRRTTAQSAPRRTTAHRTAPHRTSTHPPQHTMLHACACCLHCSHCDCPLPRPGSRPVCVDGQYASQLIRHRLVMRMRCGGVHAWGVQTSVHAGWQCSASTSLEDAMHHPGVPCMYRTRPLTFMDAEHARVNRLHAKHPG
jgi:hypothetical protein